MDASKKFGFKAIVFYTTSDKAIPKGRWLSATTIELIFFLSRLFVPTKRNYWPMKLEITGLVWVMKKVRHIIKLSKSSIIIQIVYLTIIDIL